MERAIAVRSERAIGCDELPERLANRFDHRRCDGVGEGELTLSVVVRHFERDRWLTLATCTEAERHERLLLPLDRGQRTHTEQGLDAGSRPDRIDAGLWEQREHLRPNRCQKG